MKGVGGPLLCIGDLLSDLEEEEEEEPLPLDDLSRPINLPLSSSIDLSKLFQDNYSKLNQALSGNDDSWTTLTLKLCNALASANKLVESSNSNVKLLTQNVDQLQRVFKRGDAVVANAKSLHFSLNQNGPTSSARH